MMADGQSTEQATRGVELRLELGGFIRWLLLVCVSIELALMAADYWINYRELAEIGAVQRLFNNTREDSLAGFFAIAQAIAVALTLWAIWWVVRRGAAVSSRLSHRQRAAGWLILALFFTYMAVDDGAMVHERLGTVFEELGEAADADGSGLLSFFPSYTWQLVFVPLFGALGLFTAVFLWVELGAGRARWMVVVALACLPVAVGLDFIEGLDDDHPLNVYAIVAETYEIDDYTLEVFYVDGLETLQHFSRSLEETLEMFSTTLLLVVFLGYLDRRVHAVTLAT